jgi:serine/threonine protein kinase
MLNGLEHMHSLKFIHGDIKPANLLFNEKGLLKISDFGNVHKIGTKLLNCPTVKYKRANIVVGSIATSEIDMYSFGITLIEITQGKIIRSEDNVFEIIGFRNVNGEFEKDGDSDVANKGEDPSHVSKIDDESEIENKTS